MVRRTRPLLAAPLIMLIALLISAPGTGLAAPVRAQTGEAATDEATRPAETNDPSAEPAAEAQTGAEQTGRAAATRGARDARRRADRQRRQRVVARPQPGRGLFDQPRLAEHHLREGVRRVLRSMDLEAGTPQQIRENISDLRETYREWRREHGPQARRLRQRIHQARLRQDFEQISELYDELAEITEDRPDRAAFLEAVKEELNEQQRAEFEQKLQRWRDHVQRRVRERRLRRQRLQERERDRSRQRVEELEEQLDDYRNWRRYRQYGRRFPQGGHWRRRGRQDRDHGRRHEDRGRDRKNHERAPHDRGDRRGREHDQDRWDRRWDRDDARRGHDRGNRRDRRGQRDRGNRERDRNRNRNQARNRADNEYPRPAGGRSPHPDDRPDFPAGG